MADEGEPMTNQESLKEVSETIKQFEEKLEALEELAKQQAEDLDNNIKKNKEFRQKDTLERQNMHQ